MMLYLIRHGETDWNRQRRRQGRRDIPLNEEGRAQMHRCGQLLASLPPGLFPVDAILTSPLSRATESARILADHLGLAPDRIRPEADLIERDFGDVDGMTPAELKAYRSRGGNQNQEPLSRVRQRMMRALLGSARQGDPGGHLIVISHSAAIKSVFVRLYGKPELQRKPTKNAGISVIEYRGGRLHPRAFDMDLEEAVRYLRRNQGKAKGVGGKTADGGTT